MKISKESIKSISNEFYQLENLLADADYVVSFFVTTFSYEIKEGECFDLETFKFIFNEDKKYIDGICQKSAWNEAFEAINQYLSYATFKHLDHWDRPSKLRIVAPNILQERKDIFWNIIKKHIQVPPKEVFEYFPAPAIAFNNFAKWGFCYIFLNNGIGTVIYGWAEL